MDVGTAILVFLVGVGAGAATVAMLARTMLRAERRANADRQAFLSETGVRLRETFQALSAEALRHNNQSFLDLAKTALGEFRQGAATDLQTRQQAIDALVKPIGESLVKMEDKLKEIEKERHGQYSALAQQLRSVGAAHEKLQAETTNLVKALRAPTVRGRWGEIQLRRVVEMAGMLEHCDFVQQESVRTEGGPLRPDMVVRLPGGKNVVVDAKTPLEGYLGAVEGSDDDERERMLREHARQVRNHMTKLASKVYWEQFQPAPEFVVMFLPGETFFSSALHCDPALIEYGVEKHVIPASPTTLIALLRAVAYGWRQEKMEENAQKISALGRELHERIATMAGHFADVGKGLDRAISAYNKTVGSLEGRVLVSARRFKELGVSSAVDIESPAAVDRTARRPEALRTEGEGGEPSRIQDEPRLKLI